MLTKSFLAKIRSAGLPLHKLAWEVGITPNQLYKITSGIDRPGPEDRRIAKLCEYFKLPVSEVFTDLTDRKCYEMGGE